VQDLNFRAVDDDTKDAGVALAETSDLAKLDISTVDSIVLRGAIERIRARATPNPATSYTRKHTSHSVHAKSVW
jgi:hypothetical protein